MTIASSSWGPGSRRSKALLVAGAASILLGCTEEDVGSVTSAVSLTNEEISVDEVLWPESLTWGTQSEPFVVRTDYGLVVGYNNLTDMIDSINPDTGLVSLIEVSLAEVSKWGMSTRDTSTTTWTVERQPLPSDHPPNARFSGDPWLATDGNGLVWYTGLAWNSAGDDGFAYRVSRDGGETWDDIEFKQTGGPATTDKPTVALAGSNGTDARVHVAYRCWNATDEIWDICVTTKALGSSTFGDPKRLSNPGKWNRDNPIVQVLPGTNNVYLAFQEQVGANKFNIVVAVSYNAGTSFPDFYTAATNVMPRGNFIAFPTATDRFIDNGIFMSFIIDKQSTPHCDIVYESGGNIFFTSSSTGTSWSAVTVDGEGDALQPSIAGSSTTLALVYYRQDASGGMTVERRTRSLSGGTWTTPLEISCTSSHGSVPFEPCTYNRNPIDARYYFGDYLSVTSMEHGGAGASEFYAAWTDSRRSDTYGCSWATGTSMPFGVQQHVMGVVFE